LNSLFCLQTLIWRRISWLQNLAEQRKVRVRKIWKLDGSMI